MLVSSAKGCFLRGFSSFKASQLKIMKTTHPKDHPAPEKLVFGRTFTDHMLVVDWTRKDGWAAPIIRPFAPFEMNPSISVLHYATSCFEGLKAYVGDGSKGELRLFRPEMNMERMRQSAKRIALPDFDGGELLKCIKELVKLDSKWVPALSGYSLYIRPCFIATNECIGISNPDQARLFVICGPVGPYFKTGFSAVRLLAEDRFVRSWPGGTGNYKLASNYGPTILPQNEAAARNFQQILWLFGEERYFTEVGSMNCFILMKDQLNGQLELVTPSLEDGTILPGVTRDSILHLARKWKEFRVSERRLSLKEFQKAHQEGRVVEMFGAGTAAIVCPVKCVTFQDKDYAIPLNPNDSSKQAGPWTERFFQAITEIQYGRIDHEWSVKI